MASLDDGRRDGELRGTGTFLKGEMHCHPDRSGRDGEMPAVLHWYRSHGYQYLVVTEHRVVLRTEDLSDGRLLMLPGMEMHCVDPVVGDFHMLGLGLTGRS